MQLLFRKIALKAVTFPILKAKGLLDESSDFPDSGSERTVLSDTFDTDNDSQVEPKKARHQYADIVLFMKYVSYLGMLEALSMHMVHQNVFVNSC